MEEEDYIILTSSLIDVEDFKLNIKRKTETIKKALKWPMFLPVVVYVVNPILPELKKTVYIVHMYSSIDYLIETVKNYFDPPLEEDNTDVKYGFRTEVRYANEDDKLLFYGDYPIQEIWEDYKNCGDKFLYLIFDVEKNNN